jgi:hypothetical protein
MNHADEITIHAFIEVKWAQAEYGFQRLKPVPMLKCSSMLETMESICVEQSTRSIRYSLICAW